jgi:hypothetical protein
MTDKETFKKILFLIAKEAPGAYQELKIADIVEKKMDKEDVVLLLRVMDRIAKLPTREGKAAHNTNSRTQEDTRLR